MKNKLLLISTLLLFTSFVYSQTTIISENFDGFSNGDKIVQSYNDQTVWDTWSSSPGGSEDAAISNKFANSTENSLHLANGNDVVLLFNDLTEGRYQFEFNALIESGKIGYFNMLHDFAGGSSKWAFQVYFNSGGNGKVDAAKSDAATFNFEYDSWMNINIIVDLDDDFATFYLDGEEIVSWKWSLGSFGAGSLTKLDATNFYGSSTGGTSGMYVDDVKFSEQTTPESPTDLTASVIDDVDVQLNWTAPSVAPDSYVLIRNNELVDNSIVDANFLDTPYPGTSIYSVRAHNNGLGYSHSSNEATVELPGGLDREYVLFEIGTGTGCVYCPGAAMGAVDMVENGDNVIIIKYHNYNANDPFNSDASAERAGNYYGFTGYPTSKADGTLTVNGGSPNSSLYENYHQHYLQRESKKALYSLDLTVEHVSGYDYKAEVTVNQHSAYNSERKTLHTALTESDIEYTWFNQDHIHWACRNMYPDAGGTRLDFDDTTSYTVNYEFSLDPSYVKDNCEFVVFLQADPSQEVMVATKIDLADVILGNQEILVSNHLSISPNPVDNTVYFNKNIQSIYCINDISGKCVQKGITNGQIDVSGLAKGIYFINIHDEAVLKMVKN